MLKITNYEEIVIKRDNAIRWKSSVLNGDSGTVAVLINLAGCIINCRSGLIKMSNLIPLKPILKT